MNNDFVAIKMGDLNGSVFISNSVGEILNGTRGRSSNERHPLEIENRLLKPGQPFHVPVRAQDLDQLSGMQFTLNFATDKADIVGVTPGALGRANLGLTYDRDGLVSANWVSVGSDLAPDEVLFTVELQSHRLQYLKDVVSLYDEPTVSEAYIAENDELAELFLDFVGPTRTGITAAPTPGVAVGAVPGLQVELAQNFPNPFVDRTEIKFTLPAAGEATVSVYDLHGRTLRDVSGEYPAGQHTVTLQGKDFAAGTLIYTLTYKDQKLTRTMIHTVQ